MSILTAKVGRGSPQVKRRKPPGTLIGIEAGETWLRIAQHHAQRKAEQWYATGMELPAGAMGGAGKIGRQLRLSARRAGITRGHAVCALSSPAIDIFPLVLPPSGSAPLESRILALAGEQLSYPIRDAVVDFATLPEAMTRTGDGGASVLAFAAPRTLIDAVLQTLDGGGFVVDRIVTPACALAPWIARAAPDARHLLIITGEGATSISVVQAGQVLLERLLPWSLQRLIQRLRSELDLTEPQCRGLLLKNEKLPSGASMPDISPGGSLAHALRDILGPSFQELTREASGCMGYCNSFLQHHTVSSILIGGLMACHLPLAEYLKRELELPVQGIGDFIRLPDWGDSGSASTYATAVCCALWTEEEAA